MKAKTQVVVENGPKGNAAATFFQRRSESPQDEDLLRAVDIAKGRMSEDYLGIAGFSELKARDLLSLGSASQSIADSVFGRSSIGAIGSIDQEFIRKHEALTSSVSAIAGRMSMGIAKGADGGRQLLDLSKSVKVVIGINLKKQQLRKNLGRESHPLRQTPSFAAVTAYFLHFPH